MSRPPDKIDRRRSPLVFRCGWLLMAFVVAGCHSWSQYISPRVEGRVLDAQTREPLPGTRIQRVSHRRNLNPNEPPKGGQILIQNNAIVTGADGTFVVDSQSAIGIFRKNFWFSIALSFQHAGYLQFTTNYTPANATNTISGTPLVRAGDILLVPMSMEIGSTNPPATATISTNIQTPKE